jgi:hypothetical protein
MPKDNKQEAHNMSYRNVPDYCNEGVVRASISRLEHYCTSRKMLKDVQHDLMDAAVNIRFAHVDALERVLDLRDVFGKMRAWCDEPGLDNDELLHRLVDEIRKQEASLNFRYALNEEP